MSKESAQESSDSHRISERATGYEESLWSEAAGLIQSEVDADVYLEAQGLMVAEMADVTLAERIDDVGPGELLRIEMFCGDVLRGTALSDSVMGRSADLLSLQVDSSVMFIPVHAIASASPLPRTLHSHDRRTPSWRSALRSLLGQTLVVVMVAGRHAGRLVWIGRDHISLASPQSDHGEVTISWAAVQRIFLPGNLLLENQR